MTNIALPKHEACEKITRECVEIFKHLVDERKVEPINIEFFNERIRIYTDVAQAFSTPLFTVPEETLAWYIQDVMKSMVDFMAMGDDESLLMSEELASIVDVLREAGFESLMPESVMSAPMLF